MFGVRSRHLTLNRAGGCSKRGEFAFPRYGIVLALRPGVASAAASKPLGIDRGCNEEKVRVTRKRRHGSTDFADSALAPSRRQRHAGDVLVAANRTGMAGCRRERFDAVDLGTASAGT